MVYLLLVHIIIIIVYSYSFLLQNTSAAILRTSLGAASESQYMYVSTSSFCDFLLTISLVHIAMANLPFRHACTLPHMTFQKE